ncbi:D-alanyl-D-alanine carboxypeptidase [Patescibacteria group bacterium]|nr:D-alanyl-D-alanine carboxypeptidase [Patescibacteria group bacterium]
MLLLLFVEPKNTTIKSPVPDFLTLLKNKQTSTLALWLPALKQKSSSIINEPDITAKSVIVFDIETNKVIYSKNPKEKLPMASLTKIMTAIIALENKKVDDRYIVHSTDIVGESSMGIKPGEIFSLEELLYGLILYSGNDASETIASNNPKGRINFIEMMNNKAKALGLEDTNFTNPSGLNGDGPQHTTAYDLLVMTKYALQNPEFKKIVATPEHVVSATATHGVYELFNETNLLTTYPGIKGVKTGYTEEAGWCLVSYLEYKGNKLIGVVLNSEKRREEMKELLDYSLLTLGIDPPPHE